MRDVTGPGDQEVEALRERVRALEAERDHLRNLLRSAGDIIITTDAEGRITEFKVMLRPLKAIELIHRKMGEALQASR